MTTRLVLVGQNNNTHVGASFLRAAKQLKLDVRFCDVRQAFSSSRLRAAFDWRCRGHRPSHLRRFSEHVWRACEELRPHYLLTTGVAPVDKSALAAIGRLGIVRVNYSTDDPWNPNQQAQWFLRALPFYDKIFSTRQANIDDFQRQGIDDVSYLPFGYDPLIWHAADTPEIVEGAEQDVLFVGGADRDRSPFITALARAGLGVTVFGGYWNRYAPSSVRNMGIGDAYAIRRATALSPVSLCLVRRANRDGHVMRSFEIPAAGGCMLAEDTHEHRTIFGDDGARVLYFDSEARMIEGARALLEDETMRRRLAQSANEMILSNKHTYLDRLQTMLRS